MAVKIRLARIGKKHAPVYRIVAIDSRAKRDGKYLENLGTYNPLTKEIVQFHEDRIADWISKGAIVVDSVQRLIKIKKKQAKAEKPAPAKKAAAKPAAKKTVKKAAEPKKAESKAKKETK